MADQSFDMFAAAPNLRPGASRQAIPAIVVARRILLRGGVQGLGVRPAIVRLAKQHGLVGIVLNTPLGVEIEAEGSCQATSGFERSLVAAMPQAAQLLQLESVAITPRGYHDFRIVRDSGEGPLATSVCCDQAVCTKCLGEIGRPTDRRCGYAFTSCTDCGPRYTIIEIMPFERSETAMKAFPMCVHCRHEYERSDDRRFHAQTIACPTCGPQVWCCDSMGSDRVYRDQPIRHVVQQLLAGKKSHFGAWAAINCWLTQRINAQWNACVKERAAAPSHWR